MNILLFSHVEVSAIPTAGGIQRVTQLLANAFINECGYNCYHAFYYANSKDDAKINFKDKIQLSWGKEYKDLSDFLLKNKIDLILFQNILGDGEALLQQLRRAADDVNAKIILCLHVAPDSCLAKPNASAEFYRLVGGILPKKSITKLTTALFPRLLFNKLAKWQTKKTFSQYNRYFDKIVLLSESFIDTYCEFSDISAEMKNKITAIPNPLTFSEYINPQEFDKKQKEVLILSRMSERQKRVSDALKIWQQVQNKTDISDWKLVIVGGGEDTEWLKNKAKKLKLTNYSFEGVQNPLAYYKRALIFVMTSACEGLPMTLLEAQQMGAVPVVFDSFTSLHDLIEHNTNGIIIKKKDIKKYSESLVELMQNQEKRERLAKNGLESCKKFSPENIVKQWQKLFDEMTIK